jgi:hypothetical protein
LQIINGKRAIPGDTAVRLGHWFRSSAAFWLIRGCPEADALTGRKHFFLKKEAKTFGHLAYAWW